MTIAINILYNTYSGGCFSCHVWSPLVTRFCAGCGSDPELFGRWLGLSDYKDWCRWKCFEKGEDLKMPIMTYKMIFSYILPPPCLPSSHLSTSLDSFCCLPNQNCSVVCSGMILEHFWRLYIITGYHFFLLP